MSEFGFRWVLMLLCLLVFVTAFSALIWFAWRQLSQHAGGRDRLDAGALRDGVAAGVAYRAHFLDPLIR